MVSISSQYDVGLGLEANEIRNRSLALSNKALTYVAAGIPVALTDTVGQRRLASDLGIGAILYHPGDVKTLAKGLREWALNKDLLHSAMAATQAAARERWHWDHPDEKLRLVDAVLQVL